MAEIIPFSRFFWYLSRYDKPVYRHPDLKACFSFMAKELGIHAEMVMVKQALEAGFKVEKK